MAVVQASSTPSLGTSVCQGCGPKTTHTHTHTHTLILRVLKTQSPEPLHPNSLRLESPAGGLEILLEQRPLLFSWQVQVVYFFCGDAFSSIRAWASVSLLSLSWVMDSLRGAFPVQDLTAWGSELKQILNS